MKCAGSEVPRGVPREIMRPKYVSFRVWRRAGAVVGHAAAGQPAGDPGAGARARRLVPV